ELDRVLAVLDEVKCELQNSNMRFAGGMDIGIMIEIPGAALMADAMAKKVDFFSIGTNDLVQYTLALDRNNEHVAHLYEPTHPAVLQLIANTARAAGRNGIWTGVCGEMASDLRYIPILIGLGVEELSMSPIAIGHARRLIRKISMADAEKIAAQALQASTAKEALHCSTDFLERTMPEILAAVREG
ncbi:MAG: phosphoenolpyruvate--protein phosphotransferase, partial [Lentisphaeria bacterium]|nr:phosphoenolpyruvate--protein phosphotransferase [Lentisphaeria bacterium]